MVGHKYNLNVLIQELKLEGINHTHTEFCQGRVTRWGLAWTYKEYDLISLVPPRDKPRKKLSPTVYLLPELENCDNTTEVALNKIKEMLDKLSITYKILDKRGNNVTLDMVANTNTWSNQRRKRRLQKRIDGYAKVPKLDQDEDKTTNNSVDNIEATRQSNSSDVLISSKVNESLSHQEEIDKNNQNEDINGCAHNSINQPLVHAFLKLIKKDNNILLDIEYLDGHAGKEGLHQIVQYIKNNWK